ncbi:MULTISPECIES: ATP-binding protein [Pseudomonas]|uniref:ATP-binding protein n=1 Tax=Pseudomonas TaxID=286 RepID=UPI001E5A791C|nr:MULTISPECIES: ATP-binding protein [Pseudomonas]MCD5983217.1 PAS domain-containing protein [Pseudomonas sp. CDFA 610]MCQ9469322.1 ATP-binding protein [Pseudomonas alliivorans]
MTDNKAISRETLESMLKAINMGVLLVDQDYRVLFSNRFMSINSGRSAEDLIGRTLFEAFPELPERWVRQKINSVFTLQNFAFTSWQQRPHLFNFGSTRPISGSVKLMYQNCTFFPVQDVDGSSLGVGLAIGDATDTAARQLELAQLNELLETEKSAQARLITRLEEAQAQLLQSEKMAAIGQLAAGVAHEINNPIGFVSSNVNSLRGYLTDVFALIEAYEKANDEEHSRAHPELHSILEKADYGFLRQDINDLLLESVDGLDRVNRIVQDLREFSHVDSCEWQLVDLHKGLDSTLNVIWNEVKFKAQVIKYYGDIEAIECMGSQINQVFLNLIINASHAVGADGEIIITSGREGGGVFIEIADNGHGIPPEIQNRIFEPFFTTKPVGMGSGLGLSLSYNIVMKHQGRLTVDSDPGAGSRFRIWLPLRQPQAPAPSSPSRVEGS